MPARKGNKRSYKKRTTRRTTHKSSSRRSKRTKRGGRKQKITGFTSYVLNDPFPVRRNVVLTYTESLTLTTTGGTTFGTETIYRLNSLFDPYYAAGGHQPYGFDQMALLYNRYKVNAVQLIFELTDPSADGMCFGAIIQQPAGSQTIQGMAITRVREMPFGKVVDLNNSGSQRRTFKAFIPMHLILGITKEQFHADTISYSALVTADPNTFPFLRIAAASYRNNLADTIILKFTMRFYSTFWDRNILSQS